MQSGRRSSGTVCSTTAKNGTHAGSPERWVSRSPSVAPFFASGLPSIHRETGVAGPTLPSAQSATKAAAVQRIFVSEARSNGVSSVDARRGAPHLGAPMKHRRLRRRERPTAHPGLEQLLEEPLHHPVPVPGICFGGGTPCWTQVRLPPSGHQQSKVAVCPQPVAS